MRQAISRLSSMIAADVRQVAKEALLARRKEALLTRRPPRRFTLDGVVLELGPEAMGLVSKAIFMRTYEQSERAIVAATLHPDDVVLELGAGMGFITTVAARIAREVRSYEANPDMARTAGATLTRNGSRASVTNGALMRSPRVATVPFHIHENFTESSLLPLQGRPTVDIPVFDFMQACEGATYLIVDIEGGEVDLLTGELPGIRAVCVECHPAVVSRQAITGMLASLFEQGFALDLAHSQGQVLYLERG